MNQRAFNAIMIVIFLALIAYGFFNNANSATQNTPLTTTVKGTLYSSHDGRIVLKTIEAKQFILQENEVLWRIDQNSAFGQRNFTVTGITSTYQKNEYLFPTDFKSWESSSATTATTTTTTTK